MFSIFSFPEFKSSSAISSEPPSKSPQDLILFFLPSFYLVILLSPEFFMVVLHDLIHSSRVHQDFVGGVQLSFLLASRSAINSPYSSEVEFCIFFVLLSYSDFWLWYNFTSSFEFFLISPHQAYSFVVDFLKNSIQPFLLSSFHFILLILPEA